MPQIVNEDMVGAFGFLKKAVRSVGRAAKKVVSSPVLKVVLPVVPAALGQGHAFDLGAKVNPGVAALRGMGSKAIAGNVKLSAVAKGGAAFVAPKGVPAAIAVSTADRLVRMGMSSIPAQRQTAQAVVARTQFLAKQGDLGAKLGLSLLSKTASMRKKVMGAAVPKPLPKPPVKAKPPLLKPIAKAKPRPLPAPKAKAKALPKPAPMQGWLVQAAGPNKGTIVKGGKWGATSGTGIPGVFVYSTGKNRGKVVRGKRWMKAS